MQLLVVSNLIKAVHGLMIHVVRSFAVHQQFEEPGLWLICNSCSSVNLPCRCLSAVWWFSLSFVRVVQFSQSVSCSSSAVHGSCRSFGSPCSSVAGSIGSVVQSIYTVCIIAVADQYSPAQITKHASWMFRFFTNWARSI